MPNINLYQPTSQNETSSRKPQFFGASFWFAIAILVVTIVAFVGLKFYGKSLAKQTASIETQIPEEQKRLKDKADSDFIADFDIRMKLIAQNMNGKINPVDPLKKLEKLMVPGVVVSNFQFNGGILKIDLQSDSYPTMAKQIISLKNPDYFSNVQVVQTGKSNDGKIAFSVTMENKQ